MDVELGVSEFVALVNQTFEFAMPNIVVSGELANFRVSKGKWVYFDLKDELSTLKCFGTIYALPGPLEDGMLLKVRGAPRLHNLYGFSFNVQTIQPAGEGSLRRAADLLQAKLAAEGLFDPARKRTLPYPPRRLGLITSAQSAAYADFVKILNARWGGLQVDLIDVQVQGEVAPGQIVTAIHEFNSAPEPPEVLVVIRGGGSAEDLAAFNTESVTRAVAASRVPTLVAIGHEVDVSLAELAADVRASTPSNAAELLVPDRKSELLALHEASKLLASSLAQTVKDARVELKQSSLNLDQTMQLLLSETSRKLTLKRQLLVVFNPREALKRGYAIIRAENGLVTSVKSLKTGQKFQLEMHDGVAAAVINQVTKD
ncbi:MAG TPA: exodeoxyribonuclease VII large subunit [Candidatus Saccharimonadales bacterium]|nr:exodeoxyribonuclease VII large subunit [Candidatus Saccharimonadales bacterium]